MRESSTRFQTGVGADGATPQETLRHKGPLKLDDLERGGHANDKA
jgi:hypothetical protein